MTRTYEQEPRGHRWKLTEYGEIDIFAYNPHDPHNGPECMSCSYGFCHHCQDLPDEDCRKPGAIPNGWAGIPRVQHSGDAGA